MLLLPEAFHSPPAAPVSDAGTAPNHRYPSRTRAPSPTGCHFPDPGPIAHWVSLPGPGPHRPLGVTSSLLTSLGLALQAIAQGLLKEAIASTSCPTQTILWFPVTGGLKLKLLSVVYRAGPAATLSYASNLAHTILFCTSPVPTGLLIF